MHKTVQKMVMGMPQMKGRMKPGSTKSTNKTFSEEMFKIIPEKIQNCLNFSDSHQGLSSYPRTECKAGKGCKECCQKCRSEQGQAVPTK